MCSAQELRWSHTAWGGLKQGHATGAAQPVFTRLVGPAERAKLLQQAAGGAAAGAGKQQAGGKKQKKQKQAPVVAAGSPAA